MDTNGKPVPNAFQAAVEALKSGKDIEQAVYGTPGNSEVQTENNAIVPGEEKPEISVLDGQEPDTTEVSASAKEKSPSSDSTVKVSGKDEKSAQKAPSPDKAKQYEMGMRKFQAERDALKKEKEALAKEHAELKTHWSSLEKAYAEKGLSGVLNLVAGDEKAYDAHIQREIEKRKMREDATPAQRERMDVEERMQKLEQELAKERKSKAEFESKVTGERELSEQKELQSVVNPIFDKYRFTGKLGDEEAEYYYDKAVWKETMDNLDQIPDDKLTRETIEGEFKKVSSAYRRVINRSVDNKTKKVIETKKAAASESAATRAMSGMKNSPHVEEFNKNVNSGNISDAFKQLLTGRVKLS